METSKMYSKEIRNLRIWGLIFFVLAIGSCLLLSSDPWDIPLIFKVVIKTLEIAIFAFSVACILASCFLIEDYKEKRKHDEYLKNLEEQLRELLF